MWDAASRGAGRVLGGHTDAVTAVALSPDGATTANPSDDRTVRLWDVEDATSGCPCSSASRSPHSRFARARS